MVLDDALGRRVALVGDRARVDAVLVLADPVRRTLGGVRALLRGAGDVGVALQARRTRAYRLVIDSAADGLAPARHIVGAADGRAFVEAARMRLSAVGVNVTLDLHALGLRIAVEAGL